MFYLLLIFKPIDKLFLVVVLCEQLKLQTFQTIKNLKREPSDNTLLDQQITIHGCYLKCPCGFSRNDFSRKFDQWQIRLEKKIQIRICRLLAIQF